MASVIKYKVLVVLEITGSCSFSGDELDSYIRDNLLRPP